MSPHKKVTKESGLRGASSQRSHYCAIATGNRSFQIRHVLQHPLGIPRRNEPNCRIKIGTFLSGTGSRLRCSSAYGDAGRKILKRAALIAGAINSAPLKSASFGTFLAETRKVRRTNRNDKLKFEFTSIKKHIHRPSRWLSFRGITPCFSRDASNA